MWGRIARFSTLAFTIAGLAFCAYWVYFGTCETKDCRITQKALRNTLWVLGLPETSEKSPSSENIPIYQDACFGPSSQDASDYAGVAIFDKINILCGQRYFKPSIAVATERELVRRLAREPGCESKAALLTEAPIRRLEFLFARDGDRFCKWASDTIKSDGDLFGRFYPEYPSGKYLD